MNSDFSVAVHALVYLSHKAKVLSSEELAQNVCTNPARIRKVLALLKKTSLVETREGSAGGYHLARNAQGLTLLEVAQALNARFVASTWRSGDLDQSCLICSGMGDYMDGLMEELNELCLHRLSQITIGSVEQLLLGASKERKTNENI